MEWGRSMNSEAVINGFCYIGEENIKCFFTLFEYKVTLIVSDSADFHSFLAWGHKYHLTEEVIHGITSHGKEIIFAMQGFLGFNITMNGYYEINFYAKYVLIGDKADNHNRNSFQGLLFYGDAINDIVPKFAATQLSDDRKSIIISPKEEYTYNYSVDIDGNYFDVEVSIDMRLSLSIRNGAKISDDHSYLELQ